MSHRVPRSLVTVLVFSALAALALGAGKPKTLGIDVACNAQSFVFQGPATEVGPDYGASFVVHGVIYPGGTFDAQGTGSGLLADGQAEFPELVIGTWTCRGWFIGEGMATESGPFVATTQIFDLDDDLLGAGTVVTDGLELIDVDVPFTRAITGGTGDFKRRRARGEMTQTAIDANATGLFNFRFRFAK